MFPYDKHISTDSWLDDTFIYYSDTKIEKNNSASIHIIFD